MSSNIGILLIGFNRSEVLIENYKELIKFWGGPFIVMIDGPRKDNKRDEREQEIIVDYFQNRNNVALLVNTENLGCAKGVNHAISYAFSIYEGLFIIEDDCYVNPNWINAVLHYVNDRDLKSDKILIGSDCKFKDPSELKFYYNESPLIWGWFDNRKVWDLHQPVYKDEEKIRITLNLDLNFFIKYGNLYRLFNADYIDTWDYTFKASMLKNSIKMMCFNKSFVKNIGHENATHKTIDSKGLLTQEIFYINNLTESQSAIFKHRLSDYYSVKSIIQALLTYSLLKISRKLVKYNLKKINK